MIQIPFTKDDLSQAFKKLGSDIFFVQIGAMDGITFDPIHDYVKNFGWRGVLVEPIPNMFDQLKKTYFGCSDLVFVNKAIAMHDGDIEMTYIDPVAVEKGLLNRGVLGVSTIMPDRGIIGGHISGLPIEVNGYINQYKRTISVPCCRLQTLFDEYNVRHLDVLVIDTEGADWMIAQQLDLDRYKPLLIYFEYDHLPEAEPKIGYEYFYQAGYRIRLDQNRRENFLAELN